MVSVVYCDATNEWIIHNICLFAPHIGCSYFSRSVAVCCSVLRCVVVLCTVSQYGVTHERMLPCYVPLHPTRQATDISVGVLRCVAVYCSVLQCVAVCCGVLRHVAMCCGVLRCVAV